MADWAKHFIQAAPDGAQQYRGMMAACAEALAGLFEAAPGPYSGLAPAELERRIEARLQGAVRHGGALSATAHWSGEPRHGAAPRGHGAEPGAGALDAVIAEVAQEIARHAIIVQHPHCIAHLHTPPLLSGIAAENFIAALNASMDSWDQSAAATYVEQHVVRQLCALFGYGAKADGVFTSGGTQGNIMALMLARDWYIRQRTGHNVQRHGLPGYASKLRIIGSAKSHFTLEKGAAAMGLGQQAVVRVAAHPDGTMRIDALLATLKELDHGGLLPFVLVGTAGTTDHGAIDDLPHLAAIAADHGMWFHVDAAYGGALITSQARGRLEGIEQADSLIADFHKLWFQPVSCGALLLRDGADFRYLLHRADYLNRETDDLPNLVEKTISTTRRFDALKVYMLMRAVGLDTLGAMVDHLLRQTRHVAELVQVTPGLELLAPPALSTVLFRHTGGGQDPDAFNRKLRLAALKEGVAVLGETTVDGKVALKLTILNPCLTMAAFQSLFEKLRALQCRLD